ncbi:MAG: hypothetical protein JNM52_06835 [Betaproteobacteria bacterium]|nr:hypothetical protein [Betaproteobacteria bacterium]
MTILISTIPQDAHAAAVAWALRSLGSKVVTWMPQGFPLSQRISLSFEGGQPERAVMKRADETLDLTNIRVFWSRRSLSPAMNDSVHPADRSTVIRESQQVLLGLRLTHLQNAIWVNSLRGRSRADSKINQLHLARQLGLTIPATLVSNDPDEVRRFYDAQGGEVVAKPFMATTWEDEEAGQVHMSHTTRLTEAGVEMREAIRLCPMIYQSLLKRRCDVRITIMGRTARALAIYPRKADSGRVDWRLEHSLKECLEVVTLPDAVLEQCVTLMKELDIVFGCFDYAIDEAGNWVFIEVNEMGQWIWMEQQFPEIPILAEFAQFLQAPSADFQAKPVKTDALSMARYMESADFQAWQADPINDRSGEIVGGNEVIREDLLRKQAKG